MNDSNRVLVSPEEIGTAQQIAQRVIEGLEQALFGREEVIRLVMVGFLARGHLLLEGLPGLGKTELVKALSSLLGLQAARVQFTPDLLPGDITGAGILEERDGRRQMVFRKGPLFANLVLADEINRASPKTQSALLEAMQERRVTVLGETRDLPDPFFVMATQNPIELEGTYPLPEAQVDRFLFKIRIGGVSENILNRIVLERKRGETPKLASVASFEELRKVFAVTDQILIPEAVGRYISRIVAYSHRENSGAPAEVTRYIRYGASPRAAIGIASAARGRALLSGRPTVGFEDVRAVAVPALGHRLTLDYAARLEDLDGFAIAERLLAATPEIAKHLPKEVETQ